MKILTFTTLYPNNRQQRHGIFVEQRLRKLLQKEDVDAKVVAPVPWFPFKSDKFGAYANYSHVKATDNRFGVEIKHPRYIVIPKIGMAVTPFLLALSAYFTIKGIIKEGFDFDLIDAHYYYPDGVAAALIGKWLNKPVTITARGTDINLIPQYILPRMMILWAAKQAKASITVSEALKVEMCALGAEEKKIYVLRNGVDLEFFQPKKREELRSNNDIVGRCLLSVGNLVELKGHHLVIDAMLELSNDTLLIVGTGKQLNALQKQVETLKLQSRVRFLGALTHLQLVDIYNISDVLILASSREGLANVLLESMACGTPVVATNICGTPEVVKSQEAGVLINERVPKAIVKGVNQIFKDYPSRDNTRKYAENFSWEKTVNSLSILLKNIINK